ncbi:MAG: MarR family transcriptional regulator [Actinomycetes bacterium]|jgi:DNA-binding MarR family transcriptional regulator
MTKWLNVDQQHHWRAYIAATTLLHEQLSRELQDKHGISIGDYEILVHLSEAPHRTLRMSQLADSTLASRSRLSHQIDRLERAGFVRRQACEEDRRGQNAFLTEEGHALLVAAAPTHVTGVRNHLIDLLTDDEFSALGRACAIVAQHLDQSPHATSVSSANGDAGRTADSASAT